MHLLHSKSNYRLVNFAAPIENEVPLYARSAVDSNPLYYRMARNDPHIVHCVLEANGLQPSDKSWSLLWSNNSFKMYMYKELNEYQRVNHFPGSYEMTRKDRLCENVVQRQQKYGKALFDVIPDTYTLPDEFADFYEHFQELKKTGKPNMWILKPKSLSRGRGIHLIADPSDVPIEESCIISRYIHNPLLINGLKFDIRLYVVLTSIDPLLIYVYNEGLTRFCTEKYDMLSKDNRYSHLTNYSINKKNKKFIANKSADSDNIGQKWSVTALNTYLQDNGVDVQQLWTRIYDLVIRTFIACEPPLCASYKKFVEHKRNCFELFGFDILLDESLKPWLMEVNLSPSLACETPLDFQIKSNLIADLFTLIGIRQMDKKNGLRSRAASKKRVMKSVPDEEFKTSSVYKKIGQLSRKNRDTLMDSLEEFERRRNFIRIYPAKGTDSYDSLLEVTREHQKTLYKLLYGNELLYSEKETMQSNPEALPSIGNSPYRNGRCNTVTVQEAKKEVHKVLITGDDILIEYVERLTLILKSLKESLLKLVWSRPIERFINHKIWTLKQNYITHPKLWQQLEERLIDMKERRSLLRQQREDKEEQERQVIVAKFSVSQLEDMLKSSTKNSACAVVTCLLPSSGPGILSSMTTWLSRHRAPLTSNEQICLLENDKGQIEDDYESFSAASKNGISFPRITPETEYKPKPYLSPIKAVTNFSGAGSNKREESPQFMAKAFSNSESKRQGYCGSITSSKKRVHRFYKPVDLRTSLLITEGESIEEGMGSLNSSNYKAYQCFISST
eukprot:TRINITY_DN10406_c0_g1_i4.p1 TRINITY_DN10406_c0_g1~~TRINITY_DN10406_c0_g1_i4.p1  ORF type:complete len:788 (-),score=142.32 TRINITY_DN10406_c0_g1_i4:197-2560(-)